MLYLKVKCWLFIILILLAAIPSTFTSASLQNNAVWQVAWHPSEDVLAIAFDPTPEDLGIQDQSVWLYTADGETVSQVPIDLQNYIKSMKWSPNGNYLAIASFEAGVDAIYVVDTSDLNNPQTVPSFPVGHPTSRDVAWGPDSIHLAINWGGLVEIWEVATGTNTLTLDARLERSGISELAWSADNQFADAGSEEVYVWDMNTPSAPLTIIPLDITSILDIEWSPNGNQIAVSNVGTIAIWNVNTTGSPISVQIAVLALDNPETRTKQLEWQGDRLAGLTHLGGIQLWNTTTWQEAGRLEGMHFTRALALSPDGQRIAYANLDGSLVIKTFPIANAGPDQTLSTASDTALVSLDGTASTDPDGSIVSYEWQLNGATIAAGPSPGIELPVGEYRITLLVTDNDGLIDTDEVMISVRSRSS